MNTPPSFYGFCGFNVKLFLSARNHAGLRHLGERANERKRHCIVAFSVSGVDIELPCCSYEHTVSLTRPRMGGVPATLSRASSPTPTGSTLRAQQGGRSPQVGLPQAFAPRAHTHPYLCSNERPRLLKVQISIALLDNYFINCIKIDLYVLLFG